MVELAAGHMLLLFRRASWTPAEQQSTIKRKLHSAGIPVSASSNAVLDCQAEQPSTGKQDHQQGTALHLGHSQEAGRQTVPLMRGMTGSGSSSSPGRGQQAMQPARSEPVLRAGRGGPGSSAAALKGPAGMALPLLAAALLARALWLAGPGSGTAGLLVAANAVLAAGVVHCLLAGCPRSFTVGEQVMLMLHCHILAVVQTLLLCSLA